MIINHNLMAMNTYNKLTANNASASKSLEKLSSGLRINRAGDDASGLAISEKMRGQIRGLDQAGSNAQNGISLIQTAEGALTETHSILQRMRELAVQAASDTNTTTDRNEIQKEITSLTDEIDRIAVTTEFNTQKLLDGSKKGLVAAANAKATIDLNTTASISVSAVATDIGFTGAVTITRTVSSSTGFVAGDFTVGNSAGSSFTVVASTASIVTVGGSSITLSGSLASLAVGESITLTFNKAVVGNTSAVSSLTMQIGANSGQTIDIGISSMKATDLGVRNGTAALDVTNADKATAAIGAINNAIELVSGERSKMGAIQNRLEHTINNLSTASENISSAESRIRDVDMAKEMMNYQKTSILQQAATSMLAQANQQPQNVLKLLQ